MTDAEAWDTLLNAEVTFSPNCRSGLLARCECCRCRRNRDEPVTAETEQRAREQAKQADEQYEQRQAEWRANQRRA